MPIPSWPSKFAGTAVLTISLLSLQGALLYFRPQPTENVPPLNRYSVVNIHGGNRKLLDFNSSLESDQQLSSDHHDAHGRTNDHRKLVSYTLYFWVFIKWRNHCYIAIIRMHMYWSAVLYRCTFEGSKNLFLVYLSSLSLCTFCTAPLEFWIQHYPYPHSGVDQYLQLITLDHTLINTG